MTNRRPQAGIQGLVKRIELCFEGDQYYEAQQFYSTLASRASVSKQFDEGLRVLFDGIERFCRKGRGDGAAALGIMAIDMYQCAGRVVDEDIVDKVVAVVRGFPDGFDTPLSQFLVKAVKYSVEKGTYRKGEPRLHLELARVYWRLEEYEKSQQHFLLSHAPVEHVQMMEEWSRKGFSSEKDLFIVRCVLEYCMVQDLQGANEVFEGFMELNRGLDSPLLHFCKFLLKTLERDARPLFLLLRNKYKTALERDSAFKGMLDVIGKEFYGIQQSAGFAGLLGSLLGGQSA